MCCFRTVSTLRALILGGQVFYACFETYLNDYSVCYLRNILVNTRKYSLLMVNDIKRYRTIISERKRENYYATVNLVEKYVLLFKISITLSVHYITSRASELSYELSLYIYLC
jgi:hypothetical protein